MADSVAPDVSNGPWSGIELLEAFVAAERWLELHIEEVNGLNVYPVPDGDTGTNMHLTLRAALRDVRTDSSCAVVAERIYRGALMGARGNSGVILSQILRGFSQGLSGHAVCGPVELSSALSQAAAVAYNAVMRPVEGTILTVIREAAEAAQAALTTPAPSLRSVLEATIHGAYESVQRTPSLLKQLRDAGVVDAGGQGLYVILSGLLRFCHGEPIGAVHAQRPQQPRIRFEDIHGPDDFGYCTNFMISGVGLPFDEIRQHLYAIGQSVVVVGDDELIKVHLHTLRPGEALNYAVQFGALNQIETTNMDLQRAELRSARASQQAEADAPPPEPDLPEAVASVGVVTVAPGEGFRQIFSSLHVGAVISGGQTMNPSIADLVSAIDSLPQEQVLVLPNNSNIIMAAQQAQQLTGKRVAVIPTRTVPQGIAAMFAFSYHGDLDYNIEVMRTAMSTVVTAEITTAARDALVDGVEVVAGQTIGVIDGKLRASGDDADTVIDEVLSQMQIEKHEIVTIYYGQSRTSDEAQQLSQRLGDRFPEHEVQVQSGGQPFYDYIISAE